MAALIGGLPHRPCCCHRCRDGDQCTQFDVVLAIQLPQGSNEREYFQALVYSNWAVLGLTV